MKEIEVPFRDAGCNQIFEHTIPSYLLLHSGGAHYYPGSETRRRKLG